MLRIILLILAALVLVAAILVWMGVISWSGGGNVQVNPVEMKMETRNATMQVQVPVPTVQAVPANSLQPPR